MERKIPPINKEECIMKTLVISKPTTTIAIGICLGLSMLLTSSDANAKRVLFVPEAICSTIVTNMPLPTYVCCRLYDYKQQHYVFRNQWVSGSCQNANVNAQFDRGCKPNSLVYGTNQSIPPIAGFCQFSHSKDKCL
jgi:hypothetical protein